MPLIPRAVAARRQRDGHAASPQGYGDVQMDVPVASRFGRYLVEYLGDHDFDVAHFNPRAAAVRRRVARRYPTRRTAS